MQAHIHGRHSVQFSFSCQRNKSRFQCKALGENDGGHKEEKVAVKRSRAIDDGGKSLGKTGEKLMSKSHLNHRDKGASLDHENGQKHSHSSQKHSQDHNQNRLHSIEDSHIGRSAAEKQKKKKREPRLMSVEDAELHETHVAYEQPLEQLLASLSLSKQRSLPNLKPTDLFPKRNIPKLDPLLVLYFPLGIAVAGIRMAIWLLLLLVDQPWLTNNRFTIAVLQTLLGVDVRWHEIHMIPMKRHVLVSNHVTTGDMMMLYRRPSKVIHLISSTVPQKVTKVKHHRIEFKHASVASYDSLATSKITHPIHLFPEGGMTNGRGMMKFNRGFMRFSEGLPVVPVALRATLPWDIATHTLTSSFLSNMFWFCFSPYVRLDLTVLPAVRRKLVLYFCAPDVEKISQDRTAFLDWSSEALRHSQHSLHMQGESKAAFVERVQIRIASELDIPILDFTLQAKKQMIRSVQSKEKH